MNFYLAALDEEMRHPDDQPSIGLILCKEKNRIVVEYALKSSTRPVGVAEYKLTRTLPKNLKAELPTPKQIRDGLKEKVDSEHKKNNRKMVKGQTKIWPLFASLPAETEWVEFKESNANLDTGIFNKIYEVE